MKRHNLMRIVFALFLFALAIYPGTTVAESTTLDRNNAAQPLVFLIGPVPDTVKQDGKTFEIWLREPGSTNLTAKTHQSAGTGFVVRHKEKSYLVTARHLAQQCSLSWSAVVSGPNDEAISISFSDFSGYTNQLPWVSDPVADVAVLPLKPDSKYCKSGIMKCFDIAVFVSQPLAPPRDRAVSILGFPLGLGVGKKVSPLEKESKPASGLYDVVKGTNTTTVFFLAEPSVDGFSGSPVFAFPSAISGSGGVSIRIGSQNTLCYGLVSGTLPDRTGGKFAEIVPSSKICELLEQADQSNK